MQPADAETEQKYLVPIPGEPFWIGEVYPDLAHAASRMIMHADRSLLNAAARLLWWNLLDRQGKNGYAFPSLQTLCREVGCTKPTLLKAIKDLEVFGAVRKSSSSKPARRPGKVQSEVNRYEVLWVNPLDHPSKMALPPLVKTSTSNVLSLNVPSERSRIGVPGFKKALAKRVPSPKASVPAGAHTASAFSEDAKRWIGDKAALLYEKHPVNRRGSKASIVRLLTAMAADHPTDDGVIALLMKIKDQYELWRKSEDWTKEHGRYVMSLQKWLAEDYWKATPAPKRDPMRGLKEIAPIKRIYPEFKS